MKTKKCLNCQKEFEYKRDSAKFCSDNCRVKWNYANRDKKAKIERKVLENTLLDMLSKVKFTEITPDAYEGSNKAHFGAIDEAGISGVHNSVFEPKKPVIKRPVSFWIEWRRDIQDNDEFEQWKKEYKEATYLSKAERLFIDNNH